MSDDEKKLMSTLVGMQNPITRPSFLTMQKSQGKIVVTSFTFGSKKKNEERQSTQSEKKSFLFFAESG